MATRTRRRAIARVGVDLAKSVIQVHGIDSDGSPVVAKQLSRAAFMEWCETLPKGCVVGMEACCAAHHWGRALTGMGLAPRLIAPAFVVPYRLEGKTGKSDANDASAICEAVGRPHMRFVHIKTADQQALLAVHTMREGYVRDRTACANRVRGVMAEFGLLLPVSMTVFRREIGELLSHETEGLPELARQALLGCVEHFEAIEKQIKWCDARISDHVRYDPAAKLLYGLSGLGKMGASALIATVGDASQFKNGRQFSAWL